MIFLIAGLFFGALAIASVSNGGTVIAVWWAVPSVLFIAAGLKKLIGTDSDVAVEAFARVQENGLVLHPASAEEVRRLQEEAQRSGHPLSAEDIRRLEELAQPEAPAPPAGRSTRQPKKKT